MSLALTKRSSKASPELSRASVPHAGTTRTRLATRTRPKWKGRALRPFHPQFLAQRGLATSPTRAPYTPTESQKRTGMGEDAASSLKSPTGVANVPLRSAPGSAVPFGFLPPRLRIAPARCRSQEHPGSLSSGFRAESPSHARLHGTTIRPFSTSPCPRACPTADLRPSVCSPEKPKAPQLRGFRPIAGAGFEPAAFGL
jgi:hypothetical protein